MCRLESSEKKNTSNVEFSHPSPSSSPRCWFIKELQSWWCWRFFCTIASRALITPITTNLNKYIFWFIQIYFSTETNIFGNLKKYNLLLEQICLQDGWRKITPITTNLVSITRHTTHPIPAAHPGWWSQDGLKYKHRDSKCQDYNISNLTGSPILSQ